jgi:hypothetical protein
MHAGVVDEDVQRAGPAGDELLDRPPTCQVERPYPAMTSRAVDSREKGVVMVVLLRGIS